MTRQLAEVAAQYLVKGSQIYVSGRMRTRSWEQNGEKKYATEIRADQMQMLGGRQDGQGNAGAPAPAPQARRAPAPAPQGGSSGFSDMDSDIPF